MGYLCLDEPLSSLDVISAEALRGELSERWTAGKIPTRAILMVTHDIQDAVSLADRILIMEKAPGSLPHVGVNELAVLLEHLAAMPSDRADIYRIAEELDLGSDHLLPLTEAAERQARHPR